jgi:hypothetical protein
MVEVRFSALARLLRSHMMYTKAPSKSKPPSPAPTPMPAFAPVLRPEEAGGGEPKEDGLAAEDAVAEDACDVIVAEDVDVEGKLSVEVAYAAHVAAEPAV